MLTSNITLPPGNSKKCDPVDKGKRFGEGIEFSVRFSSIEEWIPLMYLYVNTTDKNSSRGYKLHSKSLQKLKINQIGDVNLEMCNFNLNDVVRFRWLQTSYVNLNKMYPKDIWSLDNVSIYLESADRRIKILKDSFEDQHKRYYFITVYSINTANIL